jgi:HD-GYP domain-containing protein (c-di-GMP phosphodiesterase class II)
MYHGDWRGVQEIAGKGGQGQPVLAPMIGAHTGVVVEKRVPLKFNRDAHKQKGVSIPLGHLLFENRVRPVGGFGGERMATKKVAVEDLKVDMYVAELDRPWLDTPFLFQGFRITSPEEIAKLKACCNFVYVLTDETEQLYQERKRITPPPSPRFETAGINIAPAQISKHHKEDHVVLVREVKGIKRTYDQACTYIHHVLDDVRLGKSLDTARARVLVDSMVESVVRNESALTLLAQMKSKDEYTVLHCINVCILSILFGKYYGLGASDLRVLGMGALLHDIGKMGISDDILNKRSSLTEEEFNQMKRHPEIGYQLLSKVKGIPWGALEVVRAHHERIDGKGYPRKLVGDKIGLLPQIASVIDVYDATTTQRSYHDALSPHEALKRMFEHALGAFPEELLKSFIQCLSIFPVGSIVELSNDEVGIVMSINRKHHLFPIVLLILNQEKKFLDQYKLINLDFMADRGTPIYIRRILESRAYDIDVSAIIQAQGDFSQLTAGGVASPA